MCCSLCGPDLPRASALRGRNYLLSQALFPPLNIFGGLVFCTTYHFSLGDEVRRKYSTSSTPGRSASISGLLLQLDATSQVIVFNTKAKAITRSIYLADRGDEDCKCRLQSGLQTLSFRNRSRARSDCRSSAFEGFPQCRYP